MNARTEFDAWAGLSARVTRPSAAAQHVHIGSRWQPERIERRTPTDYSATRPDLGRHAERLQGALLPRPLAVLPSTSPASVSTVDALVVAVSVVALAVLVPLIALGIL